MVERIELMVWGGRSLTIPAEVIRCKVIGCLIVEVIDQPAVAQGAVGDVCYVQLLGGFD